MPRKYDALELHLRETPPSVRALTIPLSEVARIIGSPLPASAFTHRPWWGNQKETKTRPQAHAWLSAGFAVESLNQSKTNGWVRFERTRR